MRSGPGAHPREREEALAQVAQPLVERSLRRRLDHTVVRRRLLRRCVLLAGRPRMCRGVVARRALPLKWDLRSADRSLLRRLINLDHGLLLPLLRVW